MRTSRAQVPVSIHTANKERVVEESEEVDEAPADKFIRIDTKYLLPPKPLK